MNGSKTKNTSMKKKEQALLDFCFSKIRIFTEDFFFLSNREKGQVKKIILRRVMERLQNGRLKFKDLVLKEWCGETRMDGEFLFKKEEYREIVKGNYHGQDAELRLKAILNSELYREELDE